MNVIFLTSSTSSVVFNNICEKSKVLPNPSNQNFYHKLIKAVSLYENVEVVSHRPFTKGIVLENIKNDHDDRVPYHYTKIHNSILYKLLFEKREIVKLATQILDSYLQKDCVIVVDVLRRNLLNAALKIRHRCRIPVIGMITDNPYNLSKTTIRYSEKTIKKTGNLDGYLTLSEGLIDVYGLQSKPFYQFDGIVEDIKTYKKEPLGEYFAFAGSLFERYGVKNLIDGFEKLSEKVNLVVLGNGPLHQYIANTSGEDSRVLYLSQLSKDKTYAIEQHALANINPRPLDELFDKQSVPSKMLEYLASGVPTISTKHQRFYDLFQKEIYWIEDSSPEGIQKTLLDFLNSPKSEKTKRALSAKTKVYSMFGSLVQGEGISHFLKSFSKTRS